MKGRGQRLMLKVVVDVVLTKCTVRQEVAEAVV